MRRKSIQMFIFFILLGSFIVQGYAAPKEDASTYQERLQSHQKRMKMKENSLFKNLSFRSVGPVVMSGRVTDIEASPQDPYTFYVAYATGGLWRTVNNGMRFEPIFDNQNATTIGDIALDPNDKDIIWVGTGENNSSRSSYAGTGLYKTMDGGESWQYMGLGDTHHTGRIVIHPQDSDIIYVAALGHLYTKNKARGVYRTTDGGKIWEKILYVDEQTGFVDLVMDPTNPNILYAAAWDKGRKAWNFVEGGEGSGVYKSTDGGDHWKKLTGGFPQGQHVGRIGVAVYPENTDIVYALVDNQAPRPEEDQKEDAPITPRKLLEMTTNDILSLEDGELRSFIRRIGLHSDYTVKVIRDMLASGEIGPKDFIKFIRKNNPRAFNPTIIGAEVYRSDDGGVTWHQTNKNYIDRFYSTYGYYFGEVRVDPHDADHIYILGIPLLTSEDGGKSFRWLGGEGVHVDHQAMWIDPNFPDHIIDGNDGGLNLTYDGGESWIKLNYTPVGQFYTVNVDMAEPYNIYGGLQDNGVFKGSSQSKPLKTEPWERVMGGDGMQVEIDPEDFTVYTGFQFGNYYRIDQKTGRRTKITPQPHLDDPGLRYNWQTPIQLSPHSRNVLYFGSNRLFRTHNRGDNWETISPDLTTNPEEVGNVPYGTITTISESPLRYGLIYVGTDDGRIHVTKNGGATWTEIGKDLPQGLWCSRVEASSFYEGTAYVSLNGYRNDDFRAYVYRTRDYGQTWESIKANMPDEAVNVIREDPMNPHVLYVGTDRGVFVTINDAKSWDVLQSGIPISPAHDMVIHPRDQELVVGTHGRSIYVMDVLPIQELTPKVRENSVYLFELDDIRERRSWYREWPGWDYPSDPPELDMHYWLAKDSKVDFTVKNEDDIVVQTMNHEGEKGVNTFKWDLLLKRDVVLNLEKKAAKKKLESAEKSLNKARKAKKSEEEVRKLIIKHKRAKRKMNEIEERIANTEKYKNLPPEERRKRLVPTYVSGGTYTVEIKAGDKTHTVTLKVSPIPKRRRLSAEARERNKEWEKQKKQKQLMKEYKK